MITSTETHEYPDTVQYGKRIKFFGSDIIFKSKEYLSLNVNGLKLQYTLNSLKNDYIFISSP